MKWTRSVGVVALAATLGIGACGSAEEVKVVERHEAGAAERSVARLEIEGMMCEVACGGKISKELIEVPGVAHAQIDFDAARDVNFAEVEFDPKRVNPEDLASTVSSIAGGKLYAVKTVDVTHFAEAALVSQ